MLYPTRLLATALLALSCCGPARERPSEPPWAGELRVVPPAPRGTDLASLSPEISPNAVAATTSLGWQVLLPPMTAADARRRALVLDAVDEWRGYFERYWKLSCPPTRVVVLEAPFSLADGSSGLLGFWPGADRPEYQDVVLIFAGNDDLPWLFHELCHRVLHVLHDRAVDEPWWQEWNRVDDAFDAQLATR